MIKGKMNKFILRVMLCVFLVSTLILNVHASDGPSDVNLQDIPKNLANALGISLYAGKLLTCIVFFFWVFLPTIVFGRKESHFIIVLISEGFLLFGFFIAVQWIEWWYMLVYTLIVAGLWATKWKGVFY
jgi:hypothetical protein